LDNYNTKYLSIRLKTISSTMNKSIPSKIAPIKSHNSQSKPKAKKQKQLVKQSKRQLHKKSQPPLNPQPTLNFSAPTHFTQSRRRNQTQTTAAATTPTDADGVVQNGQNGTADGMEPAQAQIDVEQIAAPVPKPPSKIRTMFQKYGKIAVISYFGVYFGCMTLLPAAVHYTPTSIFDAPAVIGWCRDNDFGVGTMDWISQKLDEHPSIGTKIRANPKLSLDIGAGLLINELIEPIRIPLSIAIMKFWGDKVHAEKEAKAAAETSAQVVADVEKQSVSV
jgi:hypothetical protein